MRNVLLSALVLALLFAAVGCDSNGDEESDADVFVGDWALVSIGDTGGENGSFRDLTPDFFKGVQSLTAFFEEDGTFSLTVDYGDETGLADVTLEGTYNVVESTNQIQLDVEAQNVQLTLGYDILDDDTIELSGNAATINLVFGTTTYQGTVTIVIERQ